MGAKGLDFNSKLEKISKKTYKPHTRYKELLNLNIKAPNEIDENEKLSVIKRIEGKDTVFSLGHNNFYTITRYNRSRLYALAVYTLAEEIKKYCREKLTNYKCPKHIGFAQELPKSNVGKILRRIIKENDLKSSY